MSQPSRKEQKQLQFSQDHSSYKKSENDMDNSVITETLLESTDLPDFALMKHPIIPAFWRYGMPVFILLNIGIFFWSNTNVGAFVYLRVDVAGLTTPAALLKEFTLLGSTVDMWHAGVYTLSILIAVFSGIWPYTKLIMMMCCWVINKDRLSYKSRERILVILDTMGKWSLLDTYIMVLMLVAFRFHVLESLSSISGGLDVYVVPGFGLYSFVVGTIFSLLFTHTQIHYHRKTIEHKVKRDLTLVSKLQPKSIVKVHIGTAILVFALLFLIVGYLMDSFTFKFMGAAGWILGENESSTNYSMMSLAIYFLFSLVIPSFFLITLAILWVKPLSLKKQRSLFTVAEVLNAWSTVDVFIVSIVASLVEVIYVILLTGCGLLFGSATLYFIMSTVMIRYIQKNLEHKLKKSYNDIEENIKEKDASTSDFESTQIDMKNQKKADKLSV